MVVPRLVHDRPTRLGSAVLLALIATAASPAPVERVVVERAELPILVEPRAGPGDAGSCRDVDPRAVELRIGGVRARVHGIASRPEARLHALVLDTSESMQPWLESARGIARAYVASIPPTEPVLVASFDEGVILAAPQSLDRDRVARAIDGVEIGQRTALWESLRDLMRYLAELPGEKVMVVLTDGTDSVGGGVTVLPEVEALARGVPDTVLFVVAVDLPRGDLAGRARLHRIARSTGGDVLELPGRQRSEGVWDLVRSRLDARRYLSYEPPQGAPAGGEIRIRERSGVPCRLRPIGDPERLASSVWHEAAIERRPVPLEIAVSSCGVSSASVALDAVGSPDGATFVRLSDASRAILELDDLVLEPGPRFRESALLDPARLVPTSATRRRVARRSVVVDLPPVERLRTSRRDAVDVLRDLLLDERFCVEPAEEGGPATRPAFVIHGQTFLEVRELLGRGMLAARTDYREWSTARAAIRAEDQVRLVFGATPSALATSPSALESALGAARDRAADPRIGRPQMWLAAWLGDASAAEASRELERRLATELLRGAGEAERAVRAWPRLARLLPPAVEGRTITPLLPAYDPSRDAIGFHRFLLPAPRPDGAIPTLVEPRPLGLELLLWLRARGELGRLVPAGAEVTAIDYASAQGAVDRGADCPIEPGAVGRVVVWLRTPGGDAGSLVLVGSFEGREAPACFAVSSSSMRSATG